MTPRLSDDVDAVDDARLAALAAAPPPRRTDQAFARAVAAGVANDKKRRSLTLLALPGLVAASAVLAVVVLPGGGAPVTRATTDAGVRVASAERLDVSPDEDFFFGNDDFAIPALDGSSDEELARLDRALDEALLARGYGG